MIMLKNKRALLLSLIIISLLLIPTQISKNSSAFQSTSVDEILLYTTQSNDISSVRTEVLMDSSNRTHYFFQIGYYNGSFVILHIYDEQINVIEREFQMTNIFEAKTVGDIVYLYYSYSSQYYGTYLRLYKWDDGETNNRIIFTYEESYVPAYFFIRNETLHFCFVEDPYYDYPIIHHRIFFQNGSQLNYHYHVPYPFYYSNSLTVLNNQIFNLFQFVDYDNDTTTLQIIGYIDGSYYNSTKITMELDWFEAKLSVSSDNKLQLSLLSYEKFLITTFSINDTVLPSSFQTIYLDEYFYESYNVFSYNNATYFVFDESSDVFFVEMRSPSDYTYTITSNIRVITYFEGNLYYDKIALEKGVDSYQYHSASAFLLENG